MKHLPQTGNAVFVLASPYVSFILLVLQVLLKTTRKGLLLGLHFLLLVGVFVACGGDSSRANGGTSYIPLGLLCGDWRGQ